MAQWDVYPNPSRARELLPYLVVLQSDLLATLPTRWVAPLSRSVVQPGFLPGRMTPVFEINGERLLLKPHEAGVIDARQLRNPVATLRDRCHLLVDALDAVISGV